MENEKEQFCPPIESLSDTDNADSKRAKDVSLTMPDVAKQLESPSWAAGYADGYIDGLEEAWARINAEIVRASLPKRKKDAFRNGLLLACKLIAFPSG